MKEELLKQFDKFVGCIKDPCLRKSCESIRNINGLSTHPASIDRHHAYASGLLAHTIEVASLAHKAAEGIPGINMDVLIAACLWHDVGKLFDYHMFMVNKNEFEPSDDQQLVLYTESFSHVVVYKKSPHYKYVRHIAKSAMMFYASMAIYDFRATEMDGVKAATGDRSVIMAVEHCILSHHGRPEWGSVIIPDTQEAVTLHWADLMSARHGKWKDRLTWD